MDHATGGWKDCQCSVGAVRSILTHLERGAGVDQILALPNMPSRRTLYDWLQREPEFADAWDEIRREQAAARRAAVAAIEPARRAREAARAAAEGRPPRRKCGRKSTYTPARGQALCELIGQGLSLREIARRPGMPGAATVYVWLRNHPEFRTMYVYAVGLRDFILEETRIDVALSVGYAGRATVAQLAKQASDHRPKVWRD
jgi:hypothetical protein